MKSLRGTFFYFSLLLGLSAQAAGFYKISFQSPVIQSFLDQIEDRLPPKLKEAFPNGLQVKFDTIKGHGKYDRDGVILLPQLMIETISKGEALSGPSLGPDGKVRTHKTEFREAQAAVVHETAHAYDFLNLRPYNERAFIQNCQFVAQDHEAYQPDNCELYIKTRTTFSSDPYYLEIAGWPLSPQGKDYRDKKNVFTPRTADAYEFRNPSEHFAVNFEYYILDPEFTCRKPTMANFLNAHFHFRPYSTPCAPLTYVNPSASNGEPVLKTIPLDRVYQIHYLHAAKGKEMASRWGHSMFRVIICAPETKMGPDCMNDEFHHLVLSFRAFVGINGINSWKSLTGEYSTRLFIIPFREVKNSYIAGELRDLISYPLSLTEIEKKKFLERAVETHWNYSNQYYFLSNNCAVESLNLLKSAILKPELMDKKLIMPNELRDLFYRVNLIDKDALSENRNENRQRGLLFDNYGDRYAKAYSVITGKPENIDTALLHINSAFAARQQTYAQANGDALKKSAAIVILETAAYDFLRSKIRSSIVEQSIKLATSSLRETFEKSMKFFHMFSAPYEFLSDEGYGIPSSEELKTALKNVEQTWEAKNQNNTVKSKIFDSLFSSDQKQELQLTEDFLNSSTAEMQKLLTRQ